MKIFVLIIVCLFTLHQLNHLAASIRKEGINGIIASILSVGIGILAIIFQSLSL
jgi:hypothetical protein